MVINKVRKHGNAFCVTIPVNMLRALSMDRGDLVVVVMGHDGQIIIRKVREQDVAYYKSVAESMLPEIDYGE